MPGRTKVMKSHTSERERGKSERDKSSVHLIIRHILSHHTSHTVWLYTTYFLTIHHILRHHLPHTFSPYIKHILTIHHIFSNHTPHTPSPFTTYFLTIHYIIYFLAMHCRLRDYTPHISPLHTAYFIFSLYTTYFVTIHRTLHTMHHALPHSTLHTSHNTLLRYWAIQAGLLTPLTFAWHRLSPLAAFTSGAYFLHNGRRWQWICEFDTANFKGIFFWGP